MLHVRFSDSRQRQSSETAVVKGPRILRDGATGDVTTVVERRAEGVAGARGPACLVFNTERGFTRLWVYPADWNQLSDQELIALSERRRSSQTA